MAELTTSRKAAPKVDLTAMVDLAFLLITFFMLTTSLSKPIAMDIALPDKDVNDTQEPVPASRTMTILLGKHNKLAWYMGEPGKSRPSIEGISQIRKSIITNKNMVAKKNNGDAKKTLFIIVKPTAGAKYKNLVDVMDELSIARITAAPAIDSDHLTSAEREFMVENRIL
ncbi:biopolymer transporter ExbD [Pedobacter sp. MC2016-24]|uniref:ExbD/TolR family protein n=1 Tax=Pedobacter sp. MC2016-24 TaxID=2780090 RepID=UPI001881CFEE|nr:biopolymer transporter ExbD [Pedobacter sp. MC2016-24]MBE9603169.1 biopolymer transporter ExbD [Pedobacter sp. MC2016-24]